MTPDTLAVVVPSRGLTSKQVYMKTWRTQHQAQIRATRKAHYESHRQEQIDAAVQWAKNHREIDREKCRKFRQTHPNYAREYAKRHYHEKLKHDPYFRLKSALRARLRSAINHDLKTGSAVTDLGCSVKELKEYLEKQFREGMSWDNWGTHGWHIDHIKPLASFDLNDRKQLLEACNYKNLQPLWAKENRIKWYR